jgi:hypothetical protein
MSIDIDKDIDNNIIKFNESVKFNIKCFEKLKKIKVLKKEIESLKNIHIKEIIGITEQLNQKGNKIEDKIQEILVTKELTIEEIMSEITTINNLLNNDIITEFLIKIKEIIAEKKTNNPKYNLIDYNSIIDKTIELKKNIEKEKEKEIETKKYLFDTEIYKYIIKLIDNYYHICIIQQNNNFKESIIKIYEINKIINKINIEHIKKQLDNEIYISDNTLGNVSRYKDKDKDKDKEYLSRYESYKQIINCINNLFDYDENDDKQVINYNELIEKLKDKYLRYNYYKENRLTIYVRIYFENDFLTIDHYIESLIIKYDNNKEEFNSDELNFFNENYNYLDYINYYYEYIKDFLLSKNNENKIVKKQNIINIITELNIGEQAKKNIIENLEKKKENEIVIKHNKIKELKTEEQKEILIKELNDAIVTNEDNIIKDINSLVITKELNNDFSNILNNNGLEYKITNTIKFLNFVDINKKILPNHENILQLFNKLLEIDIEKQKKKLKKILKKINEYNQILNELISKFEFQKKNIDFISIFHLNLNNELRNIINKVNNCSKLFYYDYENNFEQIIIKDDLEQLENNINIISYLEKNIKYFIEKKKYDIDLFNKLMTNGNKNYDSINKYDINKIEDIIKNLQNILISIGTIKNIMENIKKNCLNKQLKKILDDIKGGGGNSKYDNIFNNIYEYFIFPSKIEDQRENITIINKLNELLNYNTDKDVEVNVNTMISLENDYNKENIKLLNKYKDIIKNEENYNYDEIIKKINDFNSRAENTNNDSFKISNVIPHIKKIKEYFNDNSYHKNLINIMNEFNILSENVENQRNTYRNINLKNTDKSISSDFGELCDYLQTFSRLSKKKYIFDKIYLTIYNTKIELANYSNSIEKYINRDPEKKKQLETIELNIKKIYDLLPNDENETNINFIKNLIKKILEIIYKINNNDNNNCSSLFYKYEKKSYLCKIINILETLLFDIL